MEYENSCVMYFSDSIFVVIVIIIYASMLLQIQQKLNMYIYIMFLIKFYRTKHKLRRDFLTSTTYTSLRYACLILAAETKLHLSVKR